MVRRRQLSDDDDFGAVLAAARTGAPWAFEQLYRGLAPAVVGYLRAQGAREPDDLTSEVFERAFVQLGRFAGNGPGFRSWVFTIAHHRLVDERRRLGRQPTADRQVPDRAGDDAEEQALLRLATERVRRLCERLVPDQRDVLLLRMVAGLTIDETAAALAKSPGAVKALQHRAVAALRRLATREGVSL